ncbi:ZINC/IRON TRANSPORTER [Salix koriyanagi]|uniref:ZINC/IRON TRANSPORTER n=1 Tax=Salix koriyanagi TaxID=2511006 RepID=A0A9Q0T688_9ROSI|nr:ZINC/IRON TRANSPORTER [Salix koriyanagi]
MVPSANERKEKDQIASFPLTFGLCWHLVSSMHKSHQSAAVIGVELVATMVDFLARFSKWQTFKLATVSGFAEPLGVVLVAYLFPSSLSPEILEVGGVMAFLTLHEMLPLAFDYAGQKQAVKAVFFGMAFMSAR